MFIDGVYYTTRSDIVARQECGRLRFLSSDFEGQGFALKSGKVPLLGGTHEHALLADIMGHYSGLKVLDGADPIAAAVEKVREAYTLEVMEAGITNLTDEDVVFTMQEQLTMIEGVARGFVYYRMPHILDEYDVESVEQQWLWDLGPGIRLPFRLDAILRRKADGVRVIADYKGIPYGDGGWSRPHENSLQTMLYITALEEHTGERVDGIIYEGLVRGQWKKDTAKPENSPFSGRRIQQTPYCYGFQNLDGERPVRQAKYTSRKGYKKFRVADEVNLGELTVQGWLDQMIEEAILPELFLTSQLINPAPELRHRIRNQTYVAEARYVEDLLRFEDLKAKYGVDDPRVQEHLDLMAPQITSRCEKFGEDYACGFKAGGCLSPGAGLDTLPEDEEFKVREMHHDLKKVIPLKLVA